MSKKESKSYTREYNIWRLMKRRCYNKNDSHYYAYGGRGIKVCDEWLSSDGFLSWAYENGYADDLELDRIDADEDYSPQNCRWITKSENSKRKRSPYSLPESRIKVAHAIWEECKALGVKMDNYEEPKYSWN